MDRNRRRFARFALGLVFVAAMPGALLVSRDADAKVTFTSPYTMEQTYNAALRMIRVDLGHKITERDPQAAYILFEYTSSESGNRVTPGSIEMVPRGDGVTVVIQLPRMPTYHEEMMAEQLRRKLAADYGEPPKHPAPPPPPKDKAPDGGADGGNDDQNPD